MGKLFTLCFLLLLASCNDWQIPKEAIVYRPNSYTIPVGHIGPGELSTDILIGSVAIKKKYVDIGPQPGGYNPPGFRPEKFTSSGIGGEGMVFYYKIPFR